MSFSVKADLISLTTKGSLSCTTLSRTMGAGARMGPPKEDLEEELSPKRRRRGLIHSMMKREKMGGITFYEGKAAGDNS